MNKVLNAVDVGQDERARRNILGARNGYAGCLRCGDRFDWKKYHTTLYGKPAGNGCFPLCEECWNLLSIEERVPYYRQLVVLWISQTELDWVARTEAMEEDIIKAVREGG